MPLDLASAFGQLSDLGIFYGFMIGGLYRPGRRCRLIRF